MTCRLCHECAAHALKTAASVASVAHDRNVLLIFCRAVSSLRLVPGDVIVLLKGKATCDMVLLRGNCLVEESMLSGEVRCC